MRTVPRAQLLSNLNAGTEAQTLARSALAAQIGRPTGALAKRGLERRIHAADSAVKKSSASSYACRSVFVLSSEREVLLPAPPAPL